MRVLGALVICAHHGRAHAGDEIAGLVEEVDCEEGEVTTELVGMGDGP